uniref:Secreted protein n=1 Tax=Steinernema glaseri TaxID=37863 RepID=A0A1I8AR13_9BILA
MPSNSCSISTRFRESRRASPPALIDLLLLHPSQSGWRDFIWVLERLMSGGRKRKAPDNPLDISFSSTEDGYDDDSDEPISIDEPQQNEEQANYVKESPVVLGKIASGALAPISNALFERFVAKTQKRQKAASAIEENTWFLEFEKLQKAPEGLRFSMAQPLTVHFCNQILFMKQCGNEDCGFKIVHQPNDAASVIGRCPNCCGWTPQENDEESTSLIPQYKLVCCKPVEIEGSMQLVYFILPQDVAVSLLNYGRHRRRCPVPQLRKYPGGFRWIGACPDSDGVLLLRHPPDFPYQHILLHQDRQ